MIDKKKAKVGKSLFRRRKIKNKVKKMPLKIKNQTRYREFHTKMHKGPVFPIMNRTTKNSPKNDTETEIEKRRAVLDKFLKLKPIEMSEIKQK